MALRRITAYVVPLGVMIIAFVGFATLSTSDRASESSAVEAAEQVDLPARSRVAAAVFASRFEPTENARDVATSDTRTPTESSTAATLDVEEASSEPLVVRDETPPAFKVKFPKDGTEVEDRVVAFRGTVEPGAEVFSGRFFATVSDDGKWELPLLVIAGANSASLTARDSAGNETSIRLIVFYEPPEEKPKSTATTKPPTKKKSPTTTKPPPKKKDPTTTTTTKPPSSGSQWSPKWPADDGGRRNVEAWRSTVEDYWPAERVDCVLGIIHRESRGDPRARNAKFDTRGLMQHLVKYWRGRAVGAGFVDSDGLVANPYNAAANIAAGAYLADYYDRIGKAWWNPWGGLPSYGSCGS